MKKTAAVLALVALAACGEADDSEESDLAAQVVGVVVDVTGGPRPAPQSRVTEEEILASSGKYLRVNVREIERRDTMEQVGANGTRTTWVDSAGIGLTLENGIVVATRGLIRDLMGADVTQTARAIRAGGGSSVRRHDFLNNQDQIETSVLTCEIVRKDMEDVNRLGQTLRAQRFDETCTSDGLSLTNVYWVNGAGRVVRSLQAVSPDAGYLQIDAF